MSETKYENYIILKLEFKQSSSKDGKMGFNKSTEVKVSDATEEEMSEKLRIAMSVMKKADSEWKTGGK